MEDEEEGNAEDPDQHEDPIALSALQRRLLPPPGGVVPRAGAWIETSLSTGAVVWRKVAPRAGGVDRNLLGIVVVEARRG